MERIKKYNKFSDTLNIKKILSNIDSMHDILDICKNECSILEESLSVYNRILVCCLLEESGLTEKNVDFINHTRKTLTKSKDIYESKQQYKRITSPSNIFSAYLLKMINDIKPLSFDLSDNYVEDILGSFVDILLTGKTHYSKSYKSKLLNLAISVK